MECHSLTTSMGLCSFSPNGLYVASSDQKKLSIYSVPKINKTSTFECDEAIEYIEWSTDSELILSAYQSKGKLEIWSLSQIAWRCKISAGSLGLIASKFAPSSRHVLTTSNLHLRLTIWSLNDRSIYHINLPKEANPGLDFSVGGSFMAVAERRAGKDCVAVYSCDSWTQITVICCETIDIGGLKWSPDGSKIAIWDGVQSGRLSIHSIDGSNVCKLTDVFGIHNIEWSPSAQMLAVATVGSKIKLVNHLTWQSTTTLSHRNKLLQPRAFYRDSDRELKYHVVAVDRPMSPLLSRKHVPSVSNNSGQMDMAFSSDARYLAVLDYDRPELLWIWDMLRFSLEALILQLHPIKCFKWSYVEPRVAISCGTGSLYTWTPLGCAVMDLQSTVDRVFSADKVEWSADGQYLLVSSQALALVCKVE